MTSSILLVCLVFSGLLDAAYRVTAFSVIFWILLTLPDRVIGGLTEAFMAGCTWGRIRFLPRRFLDVEIILQSAGGLVR